MITLAQFTNDQVLPYIGMGSKIFETPNGSFKVRMNSTRLECFRHNQTCVWCRNTGTVWLLQKHQRGEPKVRTLCFLKDCPWCALHPQRKEDEKPHLNLYFRDRSGRKILMTRDHVIPRSRGGSDGIENAVSMCVRCNQNKGNSFIHEFDARGHRYPAAMDAGSSGSERPAEIQSFEA